jgi:hypothetical protein
MSLFVFFISLLMVAQYVSGNHVPIIRSWRLRDVIVSCWYVPWLQGGCREKNPSMDALPANRTWQPPYCHGTYQHEAITSRSRQLLMMGTWLPETCWEPIHGRTTYQPVLTTSLQPRHIPTRDDNITQTSAPDDWHMVARNMLSSY